MTTDISINNSSLSDPEFIAKVRLVVTCLLSHPVYKAIPDFVPTLQHLDEGAQRLETAYNAVKNRDYTQTPVRREARADLDLKFGKVARYVDLACNGDPNLLRTTGFDLKQGRGKSASLLLVDLPAPVVRLVHGTEGSIIVRGRKIEHAASYSLQMTLGGATAEDEWTDCGIFTSCAGIEVKGLIPGKNYTFRMCCLAGSSRSPWSIPATLMAH